jgi:hypothetical protein
VSLADRPVDEITVDDLHALVSSQVAESLRIEYKETLPGGPDAEKKEFLYDASSFANAHGGLLLFGISESQGLPVAVLGVPTEDPDAEVARLDNLIRDGIEPRIPGLRIRAIPVTTGRVVIALRVPRSWTLPHRVAFKSDHRFYTRHSNGKHPMDLGELRAAFTLSETIVERARRFRSERLGAIGTGETPVVLDSRPRTCLHLVPISAFDPSVRFDVNALASDLASIPPMYSHGVSYRLNFDGIVTYRDSETRPTYTYLQVYRSGIFEAVMTALLEPEGEVRRIPYIAYERALVQAVTCYLTTMNKMGIEPPIFLMLSLQGVRGFTIELDRWRFAHMEPHPIDRDLLLLETMVETYDVAAPTLMKPLFDQIWNAAGWERSMSYDNEGRWKLGP